MILESKNMMEYLTTTKDMEYCKQLKHIHFWNIIWNQILIWNI